MNLRDGHADPGLRLLNGEMWVARRLSAFGLMVGAFNGITDSNMRKQFIRQHIKAKGLEVARCVIKNPEKPDRHTTITYQEAFERLYGEAL